LVLSQFSKINRVKVFCFVFSKNEAIIVVMPRYINTYLDGILSPFLWGNRRGASPYRKNDIENWILSH
jgi:hypothetical protein